LVYVFSKENKMSLDDLDQALFEAKWGAAEEDVVEVVMRMFGLSRAVVERVVYAVMVMNTRFDADTLNIPLPDAKDFRTIDRDLKLAIELAVKQGAGRTRVRWHINNDRPMLVRPAALIKDPAEICRGCEISIGCIANRYSTPGQCYAAGPPVGLRPGFLGEAAPYVLNRLKGGRALVTVTKLRGNDATVTSNHPRGTYIVQAEDLTA
jgi:hypothetical protein